MNIDQINLQFNKTVTNYDSVLIVLTYQDQFVFVKNKKRAWELTGGKVDNYETMNETAIREAYEESGAIINESDIEYIGYYVLPNGHTTTIVKAEVSYFKDIPKESETTERILTKEPLDKNLLSFQDGLYEEIFKYLEARHE
ncbi:phosphohydrolase [Staphylococcus petrasii]|uniref:NUDIX domain-containing protein n=1 Tax=Staphylococcus petrasii TaxID=1276936 RepID=A0A380FVM4_9STAP|nr:NUDIX domain-containing protein [Staphylococcus petrasii]PNZ28916.1 ADP-ribose pyrophosphatase [Staphylococcus petrasii]TGE13664.1 NUDIX domain-containing protein [Staphylococcus petrasii]TGE18183.1 NUDIX domain-containing protein [Staphylococcus petrasii]SUM42929.1 phosphohydrolase [Staphylococcus petrasii]